MQSLSLKMVIPSMIKKSKDIDDSHLNFNVVSHSPQGSKRCIDDFQSSSKDLDKLRVLGLESASSNGLCHEFVESKSLCGPLCFYHRTHIKMFTSYLLDMKSFNDIAILQNDNLQSCVKEYKTILKHLK